MLTQFTRPESASERKTLAAFIPVENVYAAGRLDYDSEGLLLLTNDGGLQHRLTDPRFGHPRTYWAQVEGLVTEEALRHLREGVLLRDGQTRPCRAEHLKTPAVFRRQPPIRFRREIPTDWIQLILTEGRNRQVRRMTAAVGLPTLRLIRTAMGTITLQGLGPGEWRELNAREIDSLKHHASGYFGD